MLESNQVQALEIKREARIDFLRGIVKRKVDMCNKEIAEFKKQIASGNSLIHILNWSAEPVLYAEAMLSILDNLSKVTQEETINFDSLKEHIEYTSNRALKFFELHSFRPNSTSAMTNLENTCTGRAHADVLNGVIKELKEAVTVVESIDQELTK